MTLGVLLLVQILTMASALSLPANTAELARRHGYDAEEHTARTDDGHLLGAFRIRNVSVSRTPSAEKDPVLIMPGLACNSAIWVMLGPAKALAYLLADRGYDVWLADYRGAMFSRKHAHLDDQHAAFWNFTLDDIGRFDVPALLHLVVRESGRPSASFIGHSMGAIVLSVMASARPQDVPLVSRAYFLAPAAYMGHASQPAVYGSASAVTRLHSAVGLFSSGEIPLNSAWVRLAVQGVCSSSVASPLCVVLGGVYSGHDARQINKTEIPFYVEYIPDSISVKNVQHFTQHFGKERDFRRFDYGPEGNLAAYDRDQPPKYNLSRSTFPVSTYYGENDFLVNPQDVIDFSQALPNLVRPPFRIALDEFSHIDFFLAIEAKSLLYDFLVRDLEEDEHKSKNTSESRG